MMILNRLVLDDQISAASRVPGSALETFLRSQSLEPQQIQEKIISLKKELAQKPDADLVDVLQTRFSLSEHESFFIALALFAEMSPQAETLFSLLGPVEGGGLPSIQAALRLLEFAPGAEWPLSSESALTQFHLLDVFERPPVGKIVDRLFRLNDRIFRFLVGDNSPAETLSPYIYFATEALSENLDGVVTLAALLGKTPVLVCEGGAQERIELAIKAAGANQLHTLMIAVKDLEIVAKSYDFTRDLFREAVLTHSVIVIDFGESLEVTEAVQKVISAAHRFQWPLLAVMKTHPCQALNNIHIFRAPSSVAAARVFSRRDLIFDREQEQQFSQMLANIKNRTFVLQEWGFDQDFSTRKGVNLLFFGASGTGKTLSAHVMANELGRKLIKIDLSSLVSKYVGETEKNIENVFREYVGPSTVVFFDEAEALFSQRTEQKTSNDRFSNLEINFLLQKLESHDGIVVLATNLEKNIDPAFFRRFDHSLRFALPELKERKVLWRSSFPASAPLGHVDFDLLAEKMKISGASIRKIALNAALAAKHSEELIGMNHIVGAAEQEHRKMGLFFRNPLEESAP